MSKQPWRAFLLFCYFACAAQARADSSGLLGDWRFDQGQGDVAVDGSGNGNHGEIWGAEWVRGPFGTALSFDGSGAHVAVPEIAGLNGSDAMTVEAWVYWEGTNRYPNIITGGTWSPGGFLLFVRDNQCAFRMGKPGVSATGDRERWGEVSVDLLAPFQTGRWYHLAATFQRPTIKTFVDGHLVGTTSWDHSVGYQDDLVIGKWSGAVGHRGLIDQVRLFRRALSPEEIAASYQREAAKRTALPAGEKAYEPIPRTDQLAAAAATFETRFAKLAVSSSGRCAALMDRQTGEDRILRTSPLVSIRTGDQTHTRAACSLEGDRLIFRFERAQATVVVRVMARPEYLVFLVDSVSSPDVDEVTFLQLQLKPSEHVHPMSGLAATDQFGVCLRALNLATQVEVGGNPPVLRAIASRERGIDGGSAALVACPRPELLGVLQDVVRNEDLPYSALGGPFARAAEQNRGSYVFARVSEENVDRWIEFARRGGIDTIHMNGWQQSLGHYEPHADLFPHGLEGMQAVAAKLHAAGLRVGIHTLTGCISTHDPWVRPVPDPRLATDGTFVLAADIDAEDADLPTIAAPGDYPTVWAYGSRGNCVRIDDELILFSAISNESPFGFSQCQRGAFGTQATSHKKGASVQHLIARYGCFIPDENSTLVDEVAERIARVYNTCELDQIYMDGAEAMRGWYGIARMRNAIFTRLDRPALVEASCWDHHSWPFHSRIGAWDHPKWGLKRFADDHLDAIQQYRQGSLLEAQLGWWVILGPDRDWDMEKPDEIEYLCAKALGHNVPLSFQSVTVDGNPPNARQPEYVTTIGRYERLRLANYFSEAVQERLCQPRQEFRLGQAEDGQWQFLPTDYLSHKVTGASDDSARWTVTNRFATQPVKLRIQALYAAYPYDDPQSMTLANFSPEDEFSRTVAAPRVTAEFQSEPGPADFPGGRMSTACFAATNTGKSPVGAWARAVKRFDPVVDMTPYDAVGLWVHGDGKGQLLNVQLTNLPEYFRTLDDHHVLVDFEGWRYFELLLRERDAAGYHDYQWPYGAHCVLHRSPLVRPVVSQLSVYLNNVPPSDTARCSLSPLRALRTRKVVLRNPTVEINGQRLVFPVDLESGMVIEFESPDDCRVYDERGQLLQWLRPPSHAPTLADGDNSIGFACKGTEGFRSRAEVTVITEGSPIQGRRPQEEVDWSLLGREYEYPRTICSLDGRQDQWHIACRPEAEYADLEIELEVQQVGGEAAAFDAPSAMALESFEREDDTFAYDTKHTESGCLAGVTQQLTRATDVAKVGTGSACYTASSTRGDSGGWSVKSRRLVEPLDLSAFVAIGFWLYGDAGGQQFKLQLRDAEGGWQDMVTRVDFSGWRFCRFDLGGPKLKDPSRIIGLNIYYNAIPAGRSVTCFIDEIRALPRAEPLRNPTMLVGGQRIVFPVAMHAGDSLIMKEATGCRLIRKSGTVETVIPEGALPRLRPGRTPVAFSLPSKQNENFRVVVGLTKKYP
jgi:hypothetical protein